MAAYAERAPSGPDGGQGPLVAAFAVALLLHLLGLVGLAYMNLHAPEAAGEQEISIDLTPAMEEAQPQEAMEAAPAEPVPDEAKPVAEPLTANPIETPDVPVPPPPPEVTEVVPQEVTPPPPTEMTQVMPEEVEPPPPPPEAVAELPPETPPPPPEEQVITSQAPEAEPLAPPPPVVAKPKEPVKPKPDPAKIAEARRKELLERKREAERREVLEEKREEQRKVAAKAKAERDAARKATQNAQGASQQNQRESQLQRSGGSNPNALNAWKGMLSSTIRGRMNRNAASGTGGGVATVRFTVTRAGSVVSASLASSSGIPAIDSAALAAVRGSLPPAPAGVELSSLAVTVPMRFSD